MEITKTETVLAPKKPGGFNLLDMFTGNKYENVTKTVLGVSIFIFDIKAIELHSLINITTKRII